MHTRAVLLASLTSLGPFTLIACGGGDDGEKSSADAQRVKAQVADTELGETDASLINQVKRAEGATQVSYKDWLLYYAGDEVCGDIKSPTARGWTKSGLRSSPTAPW